MAYSSKGLQMLATPSRTNVLVSVNFHVRSVGHLFDTDYDLHLLLLYLPLKLGFLFSMKAVMPSF